MIHSELCSACGGPLQLGVGLVQCIPYSLSAQKSELMCLIRIREMKLIVYKAVYFNANSITQNIVSFKDSSFLFLFEQFINIMLNRKNAVSYT